MVQQHPQVKPVGGREGVGGGGKARILLVASGPKTTGREGEEKLWM